MSPQGLKNTPLRNVRLSSEGIQRELRDTVVVQMRNVLYVFEHQVPVNDTVWVGYGTFRGQNIAREGTSLGRQALRV